MSNYHRVRGVSVTEWGPESEVDEPEREFTGEIEEMYVGSGQIIIKIAHPDGETVTSIAIPIQAKQSWNEFVRSLPQWAGE